MYDSGWYNVNYTMSSNILYNQNNDECNWFNDKCIERTTNTVLLDSNTFCTDENLTQQKKKCTADYIAKGYCTLYDWGAGDILLCVCVCMYVCVCVCVF